jgi:hypothetical protein
MNPPPSRRDAESSRLLRVLRFLGGRTSWVRKTRQRRPARFSRPIAFPDARAESAEGAESFQIGFSRRLGASAVRSVLLYGRSTLNGSAAKTAESAATLKLRDRSTTRFRLARLKCCRRSMIGSLFPPRCAKNSSGHAPAGNAASFMRRIQIINRTFMPDRLK